MPEIAENIAEPNIKKLKFRNWALFLIWVGIAAWGIAAMTANHLTVETWPEIALFLMAVFGPIFATVYLIAIRKKWHPDDARETALKVLGWIIGAPIILVIGYWVLSSFQDWLGPVPPWAVGIIILLIIVISKLDKN